MSLAGIDLSLVDDVERVGVDGWPPAAVLETMDGWILRATPGLDRGRSCHALTPRTRPLGPAELPHALERIRAWSALHGIRGGIQVSPLEVHRELVQRLVAAGWEPIWKVWVMVADREEALARPGRGDRRGRGDHGAVGDPAVDWIAERTATREWLANWAFCQEHPNIATIHAHRDTVFARMGGRGIFGRFTQSASGIAVEDGAGEWAGLFSLVVRRDLRGRGLGRELVRSLLEEVGSRRVYLQVTMDNAAALAMYRSFGFQISHSYQHLMAPPGWATG